MKKLTRTIAAAMVSLFFSGCAVEPLKLTQDEQSALTQTDLSKMFADQEPVDKPITLSEAMARAIMYNLDYRVQVMEEALRRGELSVAKNGLLPELTAEAGYSSRDNYNASSSFNIDDGSQSFSRSTSQEKKLTTGNLTMTWNILDFGVSLAQAKQQADQLLIAQEKKRKVIQNIIEDVRFAYWRAVSAQRLLPQMNAILESAEDTLQAVDVLHQFAIQDPMIYLEYKQELLNLILDMWNLRQDLSTARAEFAALINLPPGQVFMVEDNAEAMSIPDVAIQIDRLEGYALANRPDIRQEHYQARISAEEVKKTMVRMLPGLEISFGGNYDSNKFLVNNHWNQFGLNLSWNIFNLFTGQDAIRAAEAKHELDNMRRLSLSMAVLTQVHLAMQRYHVARKVYEVSNQLDDVEQQMVKQVSASEQAEMQNEMEVLRTRVSALLATMTRDVSYAELQNAYGRIQSSVGIDPLPESIESSEISVLARAIEENERDWQTRIQ